MGEEKDHKTEITMHGTAIKSGFDAMDKLVREQTCMRSTRQWHLKLFFSLMDAALVRAIDCVR